MDDFDEIPVLFSGKCYAGVCNQNSQKELSYVEFQNYEPQPSYSSFREPLGIVNENTCSFCLKLNKNIHFYKNKYEKLLKNYRNLKIRILTKRNSSWYNKKTIKSQELKTITLKNQIKKTLPCIIDDKPFVTYLHMSIDSNS